MKIEEMIERFKAKKTLMAESDEEKANVLAKSLVIEASQLLEHYQWSDQDKHPSEVEKHILEILAYALLLVDHYQLDADAIITDKIKKNRIKYPVK